MHAWYISMQLLLHSAFMLSVVKLMLKGEVGICALSSRGNYIADHGIVFLWEPCLGCTLDKSDHNNSP